MRSTEKDIKRKKIAFFGGGAYTIPSYRALLEKLGEDFDLTLYFEFYFNIQQAHSFRVRVPHRRIKYRRINEMSFVWMVFRDHLRKPYDLIHAHSTYPSGFWAIIFGLVFRIPVVVSLDAAEASGLPEINFGDALKPLRKHINKWVIKRADAIIALTEFVKGEVQRNFHIHRGMEVVPRGVDISKFKFSDKLPSRPLRIISVSYLHPVKDPETLLKAFAVINTHIECTLVHIGEDFLNGQVHKKVKELGLEGKVSFQGLQPNDVLPQKYAQADILLHTSRYESQAVVVNEALACGLLVCGTNVGLLSDLKDSCCVTVAPGDAAGLARAVLALLRSGDEMKRLQRNGYRWTMQHDLQWTGLRHRQIYLKLMDINFKGRA